MQIRCPGCGSVLTLAQYSPQVQCSNCQQIMSVPAPTVSNVPVAQVVQQPPPQYYQPQQPIAAQSNSGYSTGSMLQYVNTIHISLQHIS